jgi:hypothetical protein
MMLLSFNNKINNDDSSKSHDVELTHGLDTPPGVRTTNSINFEEFRREVLNESRSQRRHTSELSSGAEKRSFDDVPKPVIEKYKIENPNERHQRPVEIPDQTPPSSQYEGPVSEPPSWTGGRSIDDVPLSEILAYLKNITPSPRPNQLSYNVIYQSPSHPFEWPSTEISESANSIDETNWRELGLLKGMGYRVGMNGLPEFSRRTILDKVYNQRLPDSFDKEYLRDWGTSRSSKRLKKMASSIASFIRNAKRRQNDMSQAISDWESDLEYLYDTYYIGQHDFKWPETSYSH